MLKMHTRRRLIQLGVTAPFLASPLATGPALAADSDPSNHRGNKELVKSYIDASDRGDIVRLDSLVSPEVRWWIVSRGDFDRDLIMEINRRRFAPGVGRASAIIGMAAEDDRVAVEYETATTREGAPVVIVYHHLFECRGGKIVGVHEWTDPRVRAPRFKATQIAPPGLQPFGKAAPSEVDEAQTRAIAKAFLEPGPQNLSRDLVAGDYRWWVNGRGYDDMFAFFAKLTPQMMATAKADPPIRYSKLIKGMTVEGDRAAVLIHTNVVYPDYDYINRFHVVVRVRNGKVIEMREHTDRNASVKAGFPDI